MYNKHATQFGVLNYGINCLSDRNRCSGRTGFRVRGWIENVYPFWVEDNCLPAVSARARVCVRVFMRNGLPMVGGVINTMPIPSLSEMCLQLCLISNDRFKPFS